MEKADIAQDHIYMGPSYRTNVITSSSLQNPQYANQANSDFDNRQAGMLTNAGGDLFGRVHFLKPEKRTFPKLTPVAWEKLPSSSRKALSKSTLASLARFPSDWPEVEYLSVGGYLGDNWNYALTTPTDGFNYATVVAALVAPLSRGTVTISSADAADPPVIDPGWLTDPADQQVAVAAYKRVRALFATKAMAPVLIGPEFYPGLKRTRTDAELLAQVRQSFQTVWHASCTCRMGRKDDPTAVVDPTATVIGVHRLRVVDASAFALLPPGHPVSTICKLLHLQSPKPADFLRCAGGENRRPDQENLTSHRFGGAGGGRGGQGGPGGGRGRGGRGGRGDGGGGEGRQGGGGERGRGVNNNLYICSISLVYHPFPIFPHLAIVLRKNKPQFFFFSGLFI